MGREASLANAVKDRCWPKELKRKRIARLQEATVQAFESVRDSCSSAQQEVAKALAQAREILLHEGGGLQLPNGRRSRI